ncbi:MAG: hypothetical protein LBQ78_08875 [Tannerellaceae bacterium]|jgi:hypothetical protein|nr:hypothetical protein [Tannerellaceae bacterium]
MDEKENVLEYDGDDSIRFIRSNLPQEIKDKFSDDEITYIVDLIYDYYESKGFLSDEELEDDGEVAIDEEELTRYVVENAQKDGVGKFEPDEIAYIIEGELGYCDSIHVFDLE